MEDARHKRRVDQLITNHDAYLRGLARKLCRAHVDPDDLVQDLFEKLMRSQPLPDIVNERAWLGRVMHNLFVDRLRRQLARREDPIERVVEAPPDERVWWESLTEDAVRAAMTTLPPEQRETFELFAFEGQSYEAIANRLGIAKATVGTRILRARLRIREILVAKEVSR
jgi:RNA polymerase sigma-70 factor (ECF subfamily)